MVFEVIGEQAADSVIGELYGTLALVGLVKVQILADVAHQFLIRLKIYGAEFQLIGMKFFRIIESRCTDGNREITDAFEMNTPAFRQMA